MIIECINCSKKFDVNSELIPSEGRTIQCGSCNHIWFFKKKDALDPDLFKSQLKNQPTTKKIHSQNLWKWLNILFWNFTEIQNLHFWFFKSYLEYQHKIPGRIYLRHNNELNPHLIHLLTERIDTTEIFRSPEMLQQSGPQLAFPHSEDPSQ